MTTTATNTLDAGERPANLQDLYGRAEELRKDLAELPEGQRSVEANSALQAMFDEVNMLDHQITLAEIEERRARADLAATAGGGIRSERRKTAGELFVTEDMVRWVQSSRPASSGGYDHQIEGQGTLSQMLQVRAAVNEWGSTGPPAASGYTSSTGASDLLPVGQPIAPVPRHARLYLRDLLPKMTTTLAQIPYVRELNPTTHESASAVAEGGTKPNATLAFQAAKADPTVIAATLVISKQLFEDSAAVVQYINTRLPYITAFKEDWEFLNGSGTWPDIEGINNTSGVLSQAVVDSQTVATNAATFGAAFAQVEEHDGAPTACVLNPTNAWNMFVKRAAGGAGTFDAGTPFSALPLTVWGVPTYRTRAMAKNSALVGDFQLGGMIADREAVNVEVYRERYAEVNQILLVCEERVGLMVFRPDLFVKVTTG